MRSRILFPLCILCSVALVAQEKMYIHRSDKMTLGAVISETDSIYFSDDETEINEGVIKINYYSIIFSSSDLQAGSTYSIYTGGTCTGLNIDGLYAGGNYSGGTFRKSFTINNIITNVNF